MRFSLTGALLAYLGSLLENLPRSVVSNPGRYCAPADIELLQLGEGCAVDT